MYFQNRTEAGQKLAQEISRYRYDNCAVVALNDGGVVVGEVIAADLHCILTMILSEEIEIPGENQTIGTVNQDGNFSFNQEFSQGQIDEYYSEYHGFIEDQKREKSSEINRLLGDGGIIDHAILRDHIVVLVADGLKSGALLRAAVDFLKPIRIQRLIIAAPIASVEAVDSMHILADELHVLGVTDNFIDTNHYYEQNDVPTHEQAVEKINRIVLNWR